MNKLGNKVIKNSILMFLLVIIALLPLLFQERPYILLLFCMVCIYIISVSGLDILFGYSGQVSFGHAAFYGIGAYGSAILSRDYGLSPLLSIIVAMVMSVVIAMLLALPAARLRAHFLSLLTTAFGMIFYLLIGNLEKITGGFPGFINIPKISIGQLVFDDYFKFFYLVFVLAILGLIFKKRIVNSRIGRAFIAIREDSVAANSSGINVSRYKMISFGICAAYAAFGGAMYAHMIGFISPDTFERNRSIVFITMLILGGKGNLWGPVIGAILITFINQYFQFMGIYLELLYGTIVILILMFMPNGIAGSFRTITNNLHRKFSK